MKTSLRNHLSRLYLTLARGRRYLTCLACLAAVAAQAGVTVTNIHLFDSSGNDGQNPSSLLQGPDGNFYGTTGSSGTNGTGLVFRLTSGGAYAVLQRFNNTNGMSPNSLCWGADGNLYGTAMEGGANSAGLVFRVSPTGGGTTWYDFPGGTNDGYPQMIIQGRDGNFYGLSWSPAGTVFKLTPAGQFSVLARFAGGNLVPQDLIQGSDGNLYVTTMNYNYMNPSNTSTVYKLTTAGVITNLYSMPPATGMAAYNNFYGPLVQGSDGNLYCSTTQGGANNAGNIFRLTTSGAYTSIYDFNTNSGGYMPSGFVQGSDGNFYGATGHGGATNGYGESMGVLFKLTPAGVYQVIYVNGTNDVNELDSGLVGLDGNIYGAARYTSYNNNGAIVRVTLPQPCFCTFVPTAGTFGASGGSGAFAVSNTNGCSWSVLANQSWIHTTSAGSGNGAVSFSVDRNPGATARTGTISIDAQSYTVTQSGAPGWFSHVAFGMLWDTGNDWSGGSAYGWMWFQPGGQWIWSSTLQGWLAITDPNSRTVWSTQFRWLTPSASDAYLADTTSIGQIHVGKYNGATIPDSWVVSDRFGYVWANGDGQWFWSDGLKSWLGVTPDGGIWCVSQGRFL